MELNIDKNVKTITIWSQKLAGYLMLNGFVLVDMRKDKYGTNKNVFFFNNSEAIQERIKQYSK